MPADHPAVSLPLRRACPFTPPAEYDALRDTARAVQVGQPDGPPVWAVTRHEDVRAVLADPRFSADPARPGYPRLIPIFQQFVSAGARMMLSMDAPEHTAVRRPVIGEFTARRMKALRPRVQQIVDEAVDDLLAGPRPVDLVKALALPVPSLVICELLGVPYEDHDFFQTHSARLLEHDVPEDLRQQSGDAMLHYMEKLVGLKEDEPTDDLLGRQILKQREQGREDRTELVTLAVTLLIAGHETTASMMAFGALQILRRPELRGRLTADGDVVEPLVEELLRYCSVTDFGTARVPTEDVEIGGVHIPAGDGVVALQGAANHDPAVFPRPAEIDLTRTRTGQHHVAFGFGPHQCLGQNLARLELQVAYETLFRRVPGLRLAVPYEELEYRHGHAVFGLQALPVDW